MKKAKISLILMVVIIMLCGCIQSVQANSFNFDVTVKNAEVKEGDTLKIDMKITEITAKEGINVIEANLKYDNSIFESVIFEDANGWETTYNAESGKFVVVKLVEGITKEEKIGQIQLKLKENIEKKETQIEINEITSNDGESLINQGNRIIKIKIASENQDENKDNDKNQNGNQIANENQNQIGNGNQSVDKNEVQNHNQNSVQTVNGNTTNDNKVNGNNAATPKKPSSITGENIKTEDKIVYMIIIAIVLIGINLVYSIVKFKKLKGEGFYKKRMIISIVMLIVLMAAVIILSKDVVALSEKTIQEQIEILQKENEDNPESTEYLVTDQIISRIKPGTTIQMLKTKLGNITVLDGSTEETKQLKDTDLIKTGMKAKYEKNGREYEISVLGDINRDGILNQVQLTTIIRKSLNNENWKIQKEIEKMAADINGDGKIDKEDIQSIVDYIVFDKLEIKEVEKIEEPKVEIIKGKEIEKGTNISNVTIKVEGQNKKEEIEKTIYKITGSKITEEKEIKETEKIELTEPGVYKITSYTYGKKGNKSKGTSKIVVIEEAPQIYVNTREYTNENVKVTLEEKEGYQTQYQINDGEWKKYEKPFEVEENSTIKTRLTEENSEENEGNSGEKDKQEGYIREGQITNIDKQKPEGKIEVTGKGTSKITVEIEGQDKESGIKEIRIYAKEKGTEKYASKKYTYEEEKTKHDKKTENLTIKELKAGKTYEIYIEVEDIAGNILNKNNIEKEENTKVSKEETTEETATPIIQVEPTTWTKEKVEIKIAEEKGYDREYKINEGEWTKYTEQLEIEKNCTIKARLIEQENPENISKETTKEITNIDKLSPKEFTPTATSTTNSITLTGNTEDATANSENGSSGIAKYYFSKDDGITWEPANGQTKTSYEFTGLTPETNYKLKMKVVDNAGNETITNTINKMTEAEIIPVPDLKEGDIKFTYSTEKWTNQNVTVTANTTIEGYTLQTSKDGTTWENKTKQEFTQNGTMYVRLSDGKNHGESITTTISNIDKIKPIVTEAKGTTESITIKATDEASGIVGYAITTTQTTPTEFINCTNTKTFNTTVTGKSQNTTYYIWVKDEAGNINETKTVKTSTVPGLAKGEVTFTKSTEKWTKDPVTVTASTQIKEYILQTSKDQINWSNTTSQEYTENGTIYVRLSDGTNYGEVITETIENIDTTKPIVTSVSATTKNITIKATDEASGIIGYAITTENEEPDETSFTAVENTKELNTTVTGKIQNTTYYVWVKDEAGNISESKSVRTITVPDLTEANVTFTYNPEKWTNDSITATASTTVEGYTLQTSKNGTDWNNTTSQEYTENGTIYARLYDGANYGGVASGNVNKIDKTKPIVTELITTTNSIQIKATDEASGIIGYAVTTSATTPTEFTSCTNTKTLNTTVTGKTQNTTYYIWVKDEAGNISASKSTKTGTIADLTEGTDVIFTCNPSGWTNGSVVVTASTTVEGYTLQTSKNEATWDDIQSQEYTENGTIYVRLYDGTNYGKVISSTINNIDKIKPIVTSVSATTNTIQIKATDEASGIIGYAVTTENEEPNQTNFISVENIRELNTTVTGKAQNTTYYVWVKDEAGNISESKTVKTVTVPDLTEANVTFAYSTNGWTNQSVTITASTEIEGYTLETSKDSSTWEDVQSQEFTQNGTIYARLTDGTNYGGIASATVEKIDKMKPTISAELSVIGQTSNSILVNMNVQDTDSGISKIEWYYKTETETEPTKITDEYVTMNGETAGATTEETKEKILYDLPSGTTYSMYVIVYDVAGNSITSNTIDVSTKSVTDLIEGTNVTFTYEPNTWTNEKVIVTANTEIGEYTLQTSKDGAKWEDVESQEYTENGIMYARLWDGKNCGGTTTATVDKIDKIKPIVTEGTATTNSITIKATDEASGIIGYTVTTTDTEPTEFTSCTNTKTLNVTVTEKAHNTTYYVWVKDEAGNISESKTVKTVTIPDLTEGNVDFTYNPNGWTNKSVIVTISTEIDEYTLETSKDGDNWSSVTTQEYTENGTIFARLTDGINYGGTASATVDKIDKIRPVITDTVATTNSIQISATDEASGIIGYAVTTDSTIPTEFTSCTNTRELNTTVTGRTQNTTYYVWVKDEAGNISEGKTVKTIVVPDLSIEEGQGTKVNFTYNPEGWTKEKIIVTASAQIEGYTIQTSKDATDWDNVESQEFTENGIMYARLYDGINYGGTASTKVDKIDREKPVVADATSSINGIQIVAIDEQSGIIGYALTTENVQPDETNFIIVENTNVLNKTIDKKTEGITHYAWVKDAAGNISEGKTVEIATIPDLVEGTNANFIYNPEGWTNDKVVVKVKIKAELEEYTLETSKNGTDWDEVDSQEFTENGTIYARLYNDENYGGTVTATVDTIDKEKPVVTAATAATNSIQITATDEENGSGIIGYAVTTTETIPTEFTSCANTRLLTTTVTGKTHNTTYYVWVKDEAGNISESKTVKTITVPDLTKANVNFTYEPNGWTNKKVTVTASKTVEGYTLETSKNGTDWYAVESQEFTENGTMHARLTDGVNYGGAATAEVEKIDKVKPIVTETTATTDTIEITATDEASGIIGYAVTTENEEPDETSFVALENTKQLNTTVTGKTQNTTYYVWVKDEAGNISESKSIKTEIIPDLITEENGIKAKDIADSTDKNEYYGAIVNNYDCENGEGVNGWKIFYADENNIYLIADDYIHYDYCPPSATQTIYGSDYGLSMDNVINDYSGSSDIIDERIKALNNDYFTKGYESSSNNMKAVAYMLDTNVWKVFAGDKAEYAIGAPTIELLLKSYSQKHNVDYRSQAVSSDEYQISTDEGANWQMSCSLNTSDSLYVINNNTKAEVMWIASPFGYDEEYDEEYVGGVVYNGLVCGSDFRYLNGGFRPVVCLKSDVKLEKNEDGTYTIKDNNKIFTYNPEGWTNEKVTVTSNTKIEGYTVQTSKNGIDWDNVESQEFTENGTMYVRLSDGTNYGGSASATVDKIDKTDPTIITELSPIEQTSNSIKVSINVQDTDSGISKIVWYYKASTATTPSNTTDEYIEMNGQIAGTTEKETKEKIISDLSSGVTYSIYAVVYDVAGNSTTSETIDVSTMLETVVAKDIADSTDKSEYYGATVTGYDCENSEGVDEWKIFYADNDNIYLIADGSISEDYIPAGKNGSDFKSNNEEGSIAILDYAGSSDITDERIKALNNDYFSKGYSSTNFNMKSVAYMLDTNAWSLFAGDDAEYAIGGPTVEMFMKSYNQSSNLDYRAQANSNIGYQISIDGGTNWVDSITLDIMGFEFDGMLYTGMYIASPSGSKTSSIMNSDGFGLVDSVSCHYGNQETDDVHSVEMYGFRPIVCLKSSVQLEKNADGTYTIR